MEQGKRAIESVEELTPLASAGETAAFGLRMNRGWTFKDFHAITGYELEKEWVEEISRLVSEDLAQRDDEGIRLTARGLRFADHAASEFLRV